jgi:hypothetical protein
VAGTPATSGPGRPVAYVTVDSDHDDIPLADLPVLGSRLADLQLADLEPGSPAWNAVRAYQLADEKPWARLHYESLAGECSACANTLAAHERGRDQ